MYGDILPDELDHDWHCCQILHRSFYTDSSKKKKKKKGRKNVVFDSKKRFKKIIERFYNGFMSDFSIQLIESLFLKAI